MIPMQMLCFVICVKKQKHKSNFVIPGLSNFRKSALLQMITLKTIKLVTSFNKANKKADDAKKVHIIS